jgi:hypothetical protein
MGTCDRHLHLHVLLQRQSEKRSNNKVGWVSKTLPKEIKTTLFSFSKRRKNVGWRWIEFDEVAVLRDLR